VLSTRVARAPRGGGNESHSASESSQSPAVRHAKPLIKKKKNAQCGARAQIVGVTWTVSQHRGNSTHEIIMFLHTANGCHTLLSPHTAPHTAPHTCCSAQCCLREGQACRPRLRGPTVLGGWGRGAECSTHVVLCVCICIGSKQHSDDAVVIKQHGQVQHGGSDLCKRTAHSMQREDD
jgi:hypothetical protein